MQGNKGATGQKTRICRIPNSVVTNQGGKVTDYTVEPASANGQNYRQGD